MIKNNSLVRKLTGRLKRQDHAPGTEKLLFYITLILSFITVVIIYLKADSPYDTGDGIVHYQIARYSWKYPPLLLDLWGKPFFTLIASPFAQFGLKGMYVFQALNAAAISWFLFSIANKINLKYTWTIPAFVFFAPVYFAVMNSGLVEISFGMMFMLSTWLVFNKKFYASALVASLIPFVRPEAYVVMPLLAVIYAYRRKFMAIPLLFTAAFLYTMIGYFHFKDLLWIIHKNYQLVGDNYLGMKGSYFHYFTIYDQIWGTVYTVLLLLGIGAILTQVYRLIRRKAEHAFVEEVFVLFLGCTVGCFLLHSLLCGMPGILNNLGMLRYVATLIPSSAFIALIGLNLINLPMLKKITYLKPVIAIAVVILVVRSSFAQWYYPFKPYNEQYVMKQMSHYIMTTMPGFKKVCFLHPSLPVYADLDPYDSKRVEMMWSADQERINQLPDSTLLLWDSHFMKGEGKIPFEWLSGNPNFIMLKHYKFSNEALPFEACLFIRANNPVPVAVPVELVSPDGLISGSQQTDTITYGFDNAPLDFSPWLALRNSASGKVAVAFAPEMEYGPVFRKKVGDIIHGGSLRSVMLKFDLYQADTLKDQVFVVEIKNHDKQIAWEGLIVKQALQVYLWNGIELHHAFAEPVKDPDLDVNIYIWNKGKRKFYIHNFRITFAINKG